MIKNIKLHIIPQPVLKKLNFWSRVTMFFISIITLGSIVIDYGFILDNYEMAFIHNIYNYAWWIYFISFSIQIISNWRNFSHKTVYLTSLCGILLLSSLIPRLGIECETNHWITCLLTFLGSKHYLIGILILFAILEISKGIVSFINKKTNPALLMATGFAIIIAMGTLLLLLPRSTHEHIQLPVVDAIFVSTSAVCVTGLSPVDIAQTFTIEGQIIITILIQIGGLGVMTITSFFAMFFMGKTGLYNQFALRDIVGSDTFNSLISTLLYIFGFTIIIELLGAFFIWLNIHSTMGMDIQQEIFFAIFHAISAFCNAGFSTLSGNLGNPTIISGHNTFFIIISFLIILGGIGFPILVNLKQILLYLIKRGFYSLKNTTSRFPRYTHITNINTRIVLISTTFLIISGTIIIAFLEWDNAFAQMPTSDKLVHSFFNAVAPRTAGFNSVDLTHLSIISIIIYTLFMWIGGGAQSTAGGIKVNAFAVAIANFRSIIKGKSDVTLFNRRISSDSVRRASATIFGSIIIIIIFFITLVIMEPEIPPKGLLFETISAFGTVGSSLNITPLLGNDSKIIISILMFIGRIGIITIFMSIIPRSESPKYQLPKDNVIIN